MEWILLIMSSVSFVWIFTKLQTFERIVTLKAIVEKIITTIRSASYSDHWKEKVLPYYSLQLFSQSLLIFSLLVASLVPFILLGVVSLIFDGKLFSLASSKAGVLAATLIAGLFGLWLSKTKQNDYGVGSRFLHYLALENTFIGETTHDIERFFYLTQTRDISNEKHVFIAGLARAGTTILMRSIYEKGPYCSLTYRDMPFLLAPNLWCTITEKTQRAARKQERAHGDGLEVDFDSPEALEEFFWRTFSGPQYIKSDCLVPMVAGSEQAKSFQEYIALVLRSENKQYYLSKNNNNILRLSSICKAFPRALILVPFRNPLQQAFSLMTQHRRFKRKHAEDPFSKRYMSWLAHHEFGADHRPFSFYEEQGPVKESDETLQYWLRLWISTYTYLLQNLPPQAMFLGYENLCDDTEYVWGKLAERVSLPPFDKTVVFSKSIQAIKEDVPQELLSRSTHLYNKLLAQDIGARELKEV